MIELPPFFRRLNAQGRQRAIVRALLISRLQAALRATTAPQWHPDSYIQPGEVE